MTPIFQIPVKVRHEMDIVPQWRLGLVPIDQLQDLVEVLSTWGFFDGETVHNQIMGQFVVDEFDSYFEIVLMGER